jgi:hypothetical protein
MKYYEFRIERLLKLKEKIERLKTCIMNMYDIENDSEMKLYRYKLAKNMLEEIRQRMNIWIEERLKTINSLIGYYQKMREEIE